MVLHASTHGQVNARKAGAVVERIVPHFLNPVAFIFRDSSAYDCRRYIISTTAGRDIRNLCSHVGWCNLCRAPVFFSDSISDTR